MVAYQLTLTIAGAKGGLSRDSQHQWRLDDGEDKDCHGKLNLDSSSSPSQSCFLFSTHRDPELGGCTNLSRAIPMATLSVRMHAQAAGVRQRLVGPTRLAADRCGRNFRGPAARAASEVVPSCPVDCPPWPGRETVTRRGVRCSAPKDTSKNMPVHSSAIFRTSSFQEPKKKHDC